jgi:hypothetical protein
VIGRKPSAGAHEAGAYLAVAEEFQQAAVLCAGSQLWRAAGTCAIHAAIAAGDAVSLYELNERSNSSNHDDAADLLRQSGADGAREKAGQLGAVLRVKNRVEYEWRPISEKEARDLVKRSGRLVVWALGVVKV